jgi:hypothetical protein
MTPRTFSATHLEVDRALGGMTIASPMRRLLAFAADVVLLLVPSIVVAVGIAALSLRISDPAAFRAIVTLYAQRPSDEAANVRALGDLAPVLVRLQAPGLPPDVAVAVRDGDLERAGELLADLDLDVSLSPDPNRNTVPPGHFRLEVERLVPRGLRSIAMFGLAALYFSFFAARGRSRTPGKWLLGIRVLRLDGRPLSWWESFERFGGYLASLGTFGFGLLDFWRDPNRRMAHDRIAGTVVVKGRHAPKREA